MKKPPAPKLFKSIFQARYEPNLRFYDVLMEAARKIPEYPHWRTNRLDVTLRDPQKHCSLTIKHRLFAYSQDSADMELEKTYMERAAKVLPEALGIESFTRLGLLRRYLLPVSMGFEDLVNVMHVKLVSQDAGLRSIMPETTEDLVYRIDAADENQRYHITAGPVRKTEIPRALDFNRDDHLDPETAAETLYAIDESYPDVAVFFDIDLYREGEFPVDVAIEFIDSGRGVIHKLVSDLGEYLLSTKVEA